MNPLSKSKSSDAPVPALSLHQLSLYNTGRMSPEQIVAAFAARRPLLDRLMAEIAAEEENSRPQHHLIVGQRGMGKTMLLARIAAGLRMDEVLGRRFIPLVFAEEQYAVDRLSKFWLNCLDSLADARELAKDHEAVEKIDATVSRLNASAMRPAKDDQPFAQEVYSAFEEAAHASGQRPVLLVDNLQLVFERLEERQQHSLRELLMRSGAPVLVGASPSPPPASQNYGAAFYDHFKIHYLKPLSEDEMRELLVTLADAAGRTDVRQRVLDYPQRLKVLRQLTGGNPRTTLTLFFLYAEDFAPSVFGDLENLLDRVTPLYKARFEEQTEQQQVITSAVANHWDPVTITTLAEMTVLPPATLSAQIDRLEKTGTLERVELYGESRNGYQIAERFFNIWFLMRSASRRQRREVEFLTRFLENFYEPEDRCRLARHLMNEDRLSPDRYLWRCALEASLTEPETAAELKRHTELLAARVKAIEARTRLHELIDFDKLPPATLAFANLRQKLMVLVPSGAGEAQEFFAEAVLGDRRMFMNGERGRLASRVGRLSAEEMKAVLATITATRAADGEEYTEEAVKWFSHWLASGQLRHREDVEDWNRALQQALAQGKAVCQMLVDTLPIGFGKNLSSEVVSSVATALHPAEDAPALQWHNWGVDLHYRLGRYTEAENAYREAIVRDPKYALPWSSLGNLLQDHLERYTEAENAYREAIARDPKNAQTWNSLGNLLKNRLNRYVEAEYAYREAIACNPKHTSSWNSLGNLLQYNLKRYGEAESAYREAIVCNPKLAAPWCNLGDLLQHHLQRYTEAERAYRKAIECNSKLTRPWHGLAILLQNHLERYEEAESAYREVIARDPNCALPWNSLGVFYCEGMGRYEEAAAAFEQALTLVPAEEVVLQNRLFLRRDYLGEGSEAKPLLQELLALQRPEWPDTIYLHQTLFAAYDDNWGLARESLAKAIGECREAFSANATENWQLASAVLFHLNYGKSLIEFLEGQGDTVARLRPWVEALRALHIGDRRALQNIAPEIRTTAEVFYNGIDMRLKKLPEKTRRRPVPSETKVKRSRKR